MEDIIKNPGLQHIIETSLTFLDKNDIAAFQLVNQDCKNIVDNPLLSLKKLSQLDKVPKDLIENWKKIIQKLPVNNAVKQEFTIVQDVWRI